MEVDFVKISPTQNMTVLVTSAVERQLHAEVAAKLMAYNNVYAEQVGFVEKPGNPRATARLQMAGGEFCGNASVALGAYLVWSGKVACNGSCVIPIEVSGAADLLQCEIRQKDGAFSGTISMPLPRSIETFAAVIAGKRYTLPVVHLPGISHIIVDIEELKGSKGEPKSSADFSVFAHALSQNPDDFTMQDAFGIMFYDKAASSITPFVCVKTSGTNVWERGCGSGSAAVGAYLAHTAGESVNLALVQPGGVIGVRSCMQDGALASLSIEGRVEIAAWGKALLHIATPPLIFPASPFPA